MLGIFSAGTCKPEKPKRSIPALGMAEIITIRHNRQLYRHCYEIVSKIPRTIFWFSMILLVWKGWIIVLP